MYVSNNRSSCNTILFLIFLIFKDQWDRFEEIAEENIAKLWLSENI